MQARAQLGPSPRDHQETQTGMAARVQTEGGERGRTVGENQILMLHRAGAKMLRDEPCLPLRLGINTTNQSSRSFMPD